MTNGGGSHRDLLVGGTRGCGYEGSETGRLSTAVSHHASAPTSSHQRYHNTHTHTCIYTNKQTQHTGHRQHSSRLERKGDEFNRKSRLPSKVAKRGVRKRARSTGNGDYNWTSIPLRPRWTALCHFGPSARCPVKVTVRVPLPNGRGAVPTGQGRSPVNPWNKRSTHLAPGLSSPLFLPPSV